MLPPDWGPPPADDFGQGRWDQLPFPIDSPTSDYEYSDAAGFLFSQSPADPPRVLRVTSATATSGLYPARLEDWDDAAAAPRLADASAAQDAWCQGPNGESLSATRYDGVFLGYHSDGLPVYGVAVPGGGATLNVRETDGGSTGTLLSAITELRFDLGELRNDGAGLARLGYCGAYVSFDSGLGASAITVANGSTWLAPLLVTWPAAGAGVNSWASPEFTATPLGGGQAFQTPRGGLWLIFASVIWDSNTSGNYRTLAVTDASGVPIQGCFQMQKPTGIGTPLSCCGITSPAGSGLLLHMAVGQDSGANRTLVSGSFGVVKLG